MLSGYEQSFSEQLILQYCTLGWKLGHSLQYMQLKFVCEVHIKVAVLLGKHFKTDTGPS